MRYRIERSDHLMLTAPVREHHFEYRIAPWNDASQRLLQLDIAVEPAAIVASHRDCFGNQVHHAELLAAHDGLRLIMTAEVETLLDNPFEHESIPVGRERSWIEQSLRQAPRLWDFVLHRSVLTPDLDEELLAAAQPAAEAKEADDAAPLEIPSWRDGEPLLDQLQAAMTWIKAEITHDPDAASDDVPLVELLRKRRASCAGLAHILVAIVRGWAMPARFVAGYIDPAYFEPDDDAAADAEARPQRRHCWMEALIPGAGWRGFDPSLGLLADATFIRTGVGRDAADMVPERHSWKGQTEVASRTTEIQVQRVE
jgi:transglutaminase-like putative cysteine protease